MLKYRPMALVEKQIEDHYRQVQLTAQGISQTGRAVVQELAARSELLVLCP